MAWWISVIRFVCLLFKVLLNPSEIIMTENKNIEDSFVKVGKPGINTDFVIKLGIQEDGGESVFASFSGMSDGLLV